MSDTDTIQCLEIENKELKSKVETLANLLRALIQNIPESHSLSKAMKDQDLIYSAGKNNEFPIS